VYELPQSLPQGVIADQRIEYAKHLPGVLPTQHASRVMNQVPQTNINEQHPIIQHRQEARIIPGDTTA
jgi:hypothetical protein